MKAVILFHSVTGSCYEMAKTIEEQFKLNGLESKVYRIPDADQQRWCGEFDLAREFYKKITDVPSVILEDMPSCDVVVICSPTYFGNVSAEVKAFMDDMACFWLNKAMAGKYVIACASASTYVGGGDMALQAITMFAHHLGMVPYPVKNAAMPAYGLLHIAGEQSETRVNDTDVFANAARELAQELIKLENC